jgi:hypothetical protein
MLTHSHSATSLYNLSQFKPISDQFTSIVYVEPASNLRMGVLWPRVILCHFHILASKVSWFCLVFACHSTCDVIPKLSINMETYPHLVSSQIPHIYYFITYLYSKTIIVLWYFKQSKHSRQGRTFQKFLGGVSNFLGPTFMAQFPNNNNNNKIFI